MTQKPPIIVKLSYSILNKWASKHFEEAVGQYLGKPLPAIPIMELGRAKHELWDAEIKKTGAIPKELGGGTLINPSSEKKYEKLIPLGKYAILLRGVIDCLDDKTIYEWKCGLGSPATYVDSMQLDYYKLFAPQAELGIYRCYNPYTKTFSTGVKFLTWKNYEDALNHVITFGGEMIEYLASQQMLYNYKPEIYTPQVAML